jgi:hypothetical protein
MFVAVLLGFCAGVDVYAYNLPAGTGSGGTPEVNGANANPAAWGLSDMIRESAHGFFAPEMPAGPALLHLGAGYARSGPARAWGGLRLRWWVRLEPGQQGASWSSSAGRSPTAIARS